MGKFSRLRCSRRAAIGLLALLLASMAGVSPLHAAEPATQPAAAGQWKTAFIKRGICGAYQGNWAKGSGSIFRARTPLPFAGTKVKVLATGCHNTEVELERLFLIRGVDDQGTVAGPHFPILFAGKPTVAFTTGTSTWSDETELPITPGTWYLQDSYLSAKMPYAYDIDGTCVAAKGNDDNEKFSENIKGSRMGVVTRVDVFTTDPRNSIVCYGDSITQGYSSTPNGGKRYPELLAKRLDRPVLNMGVNGDVIHWAGGIPASIRTLQGVDTVVFLLGINDLNAGHIKELSDYTTRAKQVVDGLKNQKLKVYLGTLLPAEGHPAYTKKMPDIEKMRQDINAWIRTASGADGVIDFDRAMMDPEHPTKMKAEYQSDWLHPNDAGYEKMAETAAKVLRAAK